MPRTESNLHKHTLKLFAGDYERLREYYPEFGAAYAIRQLVRLHLEKLDKAGGQNDLANLQLEEHSA